MVDHIGDVEEEELGGYVPVAYGVGLGEAQWYCQLLEDHDIPARVDEDYSGPTFIAGKDVPAGVPVLVPESMLEEAKDVIAEVEEVGAFDDEDELEDDDELGLGFGTEEVDHDQL